MEYFLPHYILLIYQIIQQKLLHFFIIMCVNFYSQHCSVLVIRILNVKKYFSKKWSKQIQNFDELRGKNCKNLNNKSSREESEKPFEVENGMMFQSPS